MQRSWRHPLSIALFLSATAANAQSPGGQPNIVQWLSIEDSMEQLVQKGFVLSHVTEVNTSVSEPIDIRTVFYLVRGTEIVRSARGFDR